MKKHNRAFKIIAGKSGASLLFVLAVMMLLMAVGVSVLVSAGSNLSTGINKQLDNRLNIYADSMQKTILYGLKSSGDDVGKYISDGSLTTLGGQILGALYKEATALYTNPQDIPEGEYNVSLTITYNPSIKDVTDLSAIDNVEIEIDAVVRITPYEAGQPAVTEDIDDGLGGTITIIISPEIPKRPITAEINGTATVTVTALLDSGLTEKHVISSAAYELLNGSLGEDETEAGSGKMRINSAGDWGFLSLERVDRVD